MFGWNFQPKLSNVCCYFVICELLKTLWWSESLNVWHWIVDERWLSDTFQVRSYSIKVSIGSFLQFFRVALQVQLKSTPPPLHRASAMSWPTPTGDAHDYSRRRRYLKKQFVFRWEAKPRCRNNLAASLKTYPTWAFMWRMEMEMDTSHQKRLFPAHVGNFLLVM